LPPPETS